ncbi:MAG: 3-deoxy-manno-octulosonate cytidylyltransferase [Candidatus Sumerlaeaceae bacterium]|nr:3-deoxy-manno-octulosonate cytidylyltransferase [Candidatus Sumerlaeaceae bacterium]
MKVVGVIPARYASTRLPGKPLVQIAGKPMIQWVWEAALRAETLTDVLVATDDDRIALAVKGFGGEAVMTSVDCPSGTDRIAEALIGREAGVVVNIQGDEPLMNPLTVDECVRALLADDGAAVGSAMTPIHDWEEFISPSVVKVVTDGRHRALYFSRSPIPDWSRVAPNDRGGEPMGMKHLGLYVYRRVALDAIVKLPPSRYEKIEKLEQLRFLEAGYRITMIKVAEAAVGVDTPEDLARVEKLLSR